MPKDLPKLGTIKVVSIFDPALDIEAMGGTVEKPSGRNLYALTRDPDLVKIRPGHKPITFVLRAMTANAKRLWVREAATDEVRWTRSLLCCLDGIEGAIDPNTGQDMPQAVWRPESVRTDQQIGETWPVEALDMIVPDEAIEELGKLCWDRACLHPKARGFSMPPPGSLNANRARLLGAEVLEATLKELPETPPTSG